MTKEELELDEFKLNQYDYVEVKEGNEALGIYVPEKYAEDVKNFVDALNMKEKI